MENSYGKLILLRVVTVLINLVVFHLLSIPFDLIALIVGIWVTSPGMRIVIFVLEVLNLMLAILGLFFGNILGGLLGVAVSGICIYVMCLPDVKERFHCG